MEIVYQKTDEQSALIKHKTFVLKAVEEVFGVSRGRPQHGETWWWNQNKQSHHREKEKFSMMETTPISGK